MNPVVVVHGGGASSISKDRKERVRQGVVRAATVGYSILKEGKSAVDAVEGAVTVLEDDPEFNAGRFALQLPSDAKQGAASSPEHRELSKVSVNLISYVVKFNTLKRFNFTLYPLTKLL